MVSTPVALWNAVGCSSCRIGRLYSLYKPGRPRLSEAEGGLYHSESHLQVAPAASTLSTFSDRRGLLRRWWRLCWRGSRRWLLRRWWFRRRWLCWWRFRRRWLCRWRLCGCRRRHCWRPDRRQRRWCGSRRNRAGNNWRGWRGWGRLVGRRCRRGWRQCRDRCRHRQRRQRWLRDWRACSRLRPWRQKNGLPGLQIGRITAIGAQHFIHSRAAQHGQSADRVASLHLIAHPPLRRPAERNGRLPRHKQLHPHR